MTLLSRVKVLGALEVQAILILMLSILVVTRAPARAASQTSCSHTFVSSPNAGMSSNTLTGVSAVASTDVWAVGRYFNTTLNRSRTLIEHWNGTSWSVVSSPNVGLNFNELTAVSAIASNNVWAVGVFVSSGFDHTLTEHWNGASWSVVSSPSPGSSFNKLDSVSAVADNDVWAVGEFASSDASQTLTEHWNGTSWSVVSSPSPGSSLNGLFGVSANATNDVWAVGDLINTSGHQTLIEHWNGASWSVVPGVEFGSRANQLFGVTAIAHDDVWAVGDFENTSTNQFTQPLVEHWNGSSWSVVPNPAANYSGFGGEFDGVAATNSRTVWTVGRSFNYTVDQTLTERWNGSRWRVLTNPTIGTRFSFRDAVFAIKVTSGPAVVWAVGEFENDPGPQQTLTELIVC